MITGFRIVPYDLPLARPYSWARGEQRRRSGLLIQLTRDDGLAGWGEVAPPPDATPEARILHEEAHRILDRLRPLDTEGFLDALDRLSPDPRIRCGVSTAALDAEARAHDERLRDLLRRIMGSPNPGSPEVPVNALMTAQTARATAEDAAHAIGQGFRTLKLKSDGDVRRDVQRLQAIRDAVGSTVAIRLDVNGAWTYPSALSNLRAIARFDLEYVEQPAPARPLDAAAALRKKSPIPIALDESVTDLRAAQEIIARKAADVLVLKPQRLGGPDVLVSVAQAARQADVPCVVTNSLETAIGRTSALHAAATLPLPQRACGLATESFMAEDTARDAPRSRDGILRVPDGPGLGIVPDVPQSEPSPLGAS